jgi:hypothetical protein
VVCTLPNTATRCTVGARRITKDSIRDVGGFTHRTWILFIQNVQNDYSIKRVRANNQVPDLFWYEFALS